MKTMTTRTICQLTPMAAFAGVADEVADHRVIDDALQPGDDVLQHRRPRQPPDRRPDRTLDDRAIEVFASGAYRWPRLGSVHTPSAGRSVGRHARVELCQNRELEPMDHLRRLFDNNRELVEQAHARLTPSSSAARPRKQEPHFLFIGCADSRVPARDADRRAAGRDVRPSQHRQPGAAERPEPAVGAAVRGGGAGRQARDRVRAPPVRRREGGDGATTTHGLVDHWLAGIRDSLHRHRDELERLRRRTGQVRPAGGAERAAAGVQPGAQRRSCRTPGSAAAGRSCTAWSTT